MDDDSPQNGGQSPTPSTADPDFRSRIIDAIRTGQEDQERFGGHLPRGASEEETPKRRWVKPALVAAVVSALVVAGWKLLPPVLHYSSGLLAQYTGTDLRSPQPAAGPAVPVVAEKSKPKRSRSAPIQVKEPSDYLPKPDSEIPRSVPAHVQAGAGGPIPTVTMRSPMRVLITPRESMALLLRKVDPVYPEMARARGLEGAVVLRVLIGSEGTVRHLEAVSGDGSLIPAAISAVRQWQYRPYYLDSQPREVETTVVVEFALATPGKAN